MTAHFVEVSDRTETAVTPVTLTSRSRWYRNFGKRIFDILFTVATLPIVLPIIFLAALAVMLDGHKPFFTQARLGRGGRIFPILKLRTMRPDAEALLHRHLQRHPEDESEWLRKQKLKNDPRITAVGHFLRKTSIDELPQVFNVLVGQMSIVGPRPMMPSQRAIYPGDGYFRVRPGITGPWQISVRNDSDFAERAKFDNEYVRRIGMTRDIRIILRTAVVVLRGTGC